MGVIDQIKQVFRVGASASETLDKVNTKSFARGASDQSFTFPCLMDDTIGPGMCGTLAQNLDRVYASWVQIYLSGVGIIDLNYIKNPRQFVAKYQPNLSAFEEADDILESCDERLKDGLYGDDELLFTTPNGLFLITKGDCNRAIMESAKEAGKSPMDIFNTKALYQNYFLEAKKDTGPSAEEILANTISNQNRREALQDRSASLRATANVSGPRLSDSDVKKVNDMQPYALDLRLMATRGDTALAEWINFTVGVKTWLHLGTSAKLVENIVDVLRNRNPLFNWIRWTTGEISLFKDIILHLDDINFDIANKSDRTGKFISSLKNLKKKFVKVGSFGVSRLSPFATIAISSITYELIKTKYGYDLKNMAFAKKLMSELFLMCFIIIDDAAHTYDILTDGQADYQTYSLETLEREVTMRSSKLSKELTRMLGAN